ncbi:protein mini spindles isoform X2 [Aethina tumida]|uniref:protein mini spindles isoform X2 n=1 Tax=Aethina tumida TaxID=116153 RepID=UPI0021494107|nr:protein mini spindles isoform X2 [Aethina tumida]
MEDDEYKKLPVEDRCVHKLWKARVNGYEDVTKLFRQIDDEKSPEFSKYLGLVKKFVVDSNAMGQEKGLEATLAYVENYALAGKTVSEVMSGIVTKCIAAPKTKTRDLALQVTLMYVEIEKHEAVVEELTKGMEQKNPKIVAACINACTVALREFGSKIINVKPLIKKISTLFADRDKSVRDEARQMVIEIYRWIGPALKPQLTNLQPVQLTELEAEFTKIDGQKAVPTRYIRSQQKQQAKIAAEAEEVDGGGDEDEDNEEVAVEVDPYDVADPVDILSKLPKDFYDKLEAKKWQERKEAVETLENLVKTPKLENGDYGDLVRALKKIVQKDSNVVVVALAGRCIALLASGLKKRFQTYSGACVPALLEKFKEKKQNVVTAIRDAIDAVYLTTNLEAILEDVLEALGNKNPSVKAETSLFVARAFTKTQPTAVNKKLLKALTTTLTKNINESDPVVRDAAAEAIGTLMKLVGEKAIGPFLVELEKDNLKMTKIKECCDKAVITVKTVGGGGKKERAATAPARGEPKPAPEPVKSAPPRAAAKKPPAKKKAEISSGSATVTRPKGTKPTPKVQPVKPIEKTLSDEEAEEIASSIIPPNLVAELADTNWKTRLAAVERVSSDLRDLDAKSVPTQAVVKTLSKKPGYKDTNFQVLKAKLDVVRYLAENCQFSTTTAECCLNDVAEKFGDAKNGATVAEVMTAIAEATSLSFVSEGVMNFVFSQKSPKVMQEALIWLSGAIKEFGFANLNTKLLIDNNKKALASINPQVRQASITLLGTMYLYMGPNLNVYFDNEKASLRDQINVEFDKYEGVSPPAPTRGLSKSSSSGTICDDGDDAPVDAAEPEPVTVQDLLPRVDISSQITEALINELSDKNWKVRNEGLTKVAAILQEAKFIKPNIGDLAPALAHRLTDSNIKIAQTAINICEVIAKAMGPPCRQYVRTLFPGFLQALGDSKSWMRTAALDAINTFAEQCGYKEFFDGEMIADALKSGSPTLRSELWTWLADKIPKIPVKSIPKEELMACIPHLYNNLEDRNADVRKNATEAILGIMIHVGYDTMAKQTEKLKPGSKMVIMAALEKVRPNLPVKPLPKKQSPSEKEDKAVRGTKPVANAKNAVKPKGPATQKAAPAPAASSRKKEEDVDTSPLLALNNLKNQRSLDESKLKVLKWNFTQPRDEFVELLKDQMAAANVNKTLMANMFHSDFRYHIKALESLSEDLPNNKEALQANLDLILKWLTLRFFDTNPSVLLKGLEYLQSVFNVLIENKYHMQENEASSFIPYLVLKIGDPKDSVRNGVRALFKQICNIYPVHRLFTYIMEGIKSKNARQRAECLDAMGSIIETYGITICVPSPAACLKEVAKQISDRDNSVRNAALNCATQAYFIVGEKVFKMVGNISEKDMSLLEERIKRSHKKMSTVAPKLKADPNATVSMPKSPPPPVHESPVRNGNDSGSNEQDEEVDDEDEDNIPAVTVTPMSPPKPIAPSVYEKTLTKKFTTRPKSEIDDDIEKYIKRVKSVDRGIAVEAIEHLNEILQSNKGVAVGEYEDDFMSAVATQLKHLSSFDPSTDEEVVKMYRALLMLIDGFYKNKGFGSKVSVAVLMDLLNQMINLLVEGKLEKCNSGDSYVRVVNSHCVKIIDKSDHTKIICALIQLLQDCIRNDIGLRHTDLVMKSIWRVLKLMPGWSNQIDYDSVLLEIHFFLKEFPTTWWKSRESDTPLRTIKTILHATVKQRGASICLHMSKIPNTKESELEAYINKLIKMMKTDENKPVVPLTRAYHNMLTEIFQKIGKQDETKDGITLLYDFMQQHPEADIDPYLKKTNKFFQDYIKTGLKDIEDERKTAKAQIVEKASGTSSAPTQAKSELATKDIDYYMNRLSFWKNRYSDVKVPHE